jgi:hypothetical protein
MKKLINKILYGSSLIAYSSKNEIQAFKILEKIPNRIDIGINYIVHYSDIENFFDTLAYKRDYKINYLLGNKDQYIVINVPNIQFNNYDDHLVKTKFLKTIHSKVYQMNNSDSDIKNHLIYLTHTYNTFDGKFAIKGGTQLIYMMDLVITIDNDVLRVVKDRNGVESTYDIKSELREIDLKNILDEN